MTSLSCPELPYFLSTFFIVLFVCLFVFFFTFTYMFSLKTQELLLGANT